MNTQIKERTYQSQPNTADTDTMSLAAKCCICTDEFSSIDDLEAHLSADHYNCLPFECEKCKFAKFPTEFAIKRHYEEDHGLVEYFVRYRVSREIYEKKQKVRECLESCVCHSTPTAAAADAHPNPGQQQIGGGAGKTTISVEYSQHPHQPQYHLHESEFLTPSKVRRNASSPSDLFQSAHRTLSTALGSSEIRHHQSELLGGEVGGGGGRHEQGFDQMGSSLMGNILEHIKPDIDGNVLSHFDQLYAAEGTEGLKGIGQQHNEHELVSIHHHKSSQIPGLGVGSTGVNVVNTGLIGKPQYSAIIGHSAGTGSRKPPELQCQVCKQMVVNRSTSLMYHVNVKHLKLAIFKCKQCGEEFLWNRPAANRHAKRHGGDESLIENNTERLFPILNRHRREYFNLSYGKTSISPKLDQNSVSGEEQKMELDKQMSALKEETGSGDEQLNESTKKVEVEEAVEENSEEISAEQRRERSKEKEEDQSTPNTILAQLVDMTRGGETTTTVVVGGGGGGMASSSQQQMGGTVQQGEAGGNKLQKSVKCEGCGDSVINQEWILLNHVNTKHLHLPLYKCVSCDKPFENYLRSYAVRHAKFYHAGDESLLLDQRDKFWGGLREACSKLFGIGKNGVAMDQ